MNKKISITLVLLMIISIFSFSSCGVKSTDNGDITGYSKNISVVNRSVPDFQIKDNDDFTILQISDLHLISGTTKKDIKTLTAVENQIVQLNPMLVVVSGDMIEGNNDKDNYNKKAALQTISEMFERLKQYWAYVPGNNDGEFMGNTGDVVAFLSQYSYCIVSDAGNITGATQYSVDLKNSGGHTVHSLIFLDSLARDENNKYDYMKDDQAAWLKLTLDNKKMYGDNVRTSLFFHMNTPDFTLAAEKGVNYNDSYNTIPTDLKNNIPGNSKIDDVIESSKIVGLVSIGHIHPNTNWCSFYENRYYHITRAAGFYATKNPGCVFITIHTSADSIKNMYDFEEIIFDKDK